MNLFDINKIYYEASALKSNRGLEIWNQYPNAEKILVSSHWNIPELNSNSLLVDDWNKTKKEVLVLGTKKNLYFRDNSRSTDFIAPSHSNGWDSISVNL